jgi:hypothetical protein
MLAVCASLDASVSVTLSPEVMESALAVRAHEGAGGVTTVLVISSPEGVDEASPANTCGGTDNAASENIAHAANSLRAILTWASTKYERFIGVVINV